MTTPAPAIRPTVWILDDSALEAMMARRTLTHDYDVTVFTDGNALLEHLASHTAPTTLVLDLQLPGMSGIEVCRFLRAQYDESSLPILMLTVYGHKSDLLEGLDAGANDYLTKPYDPAELRARVALLTRVKLLFESEKRARADAEMANSAKDEFVAMVSHELRTPLNAILGWTRLLRANEVPEERRTRALETVERNALAQARLIEDLLDMSRILSGTFRIEKEPVEIMNVVNLAMDGVRGVAQAKGIALTQEIHPDGGCVMGDPARLQQVVDNLLTNAVKFTPNGGSIRLTVDLRDELEISVADSGAGIDPSFMPYVFDRFRQGESVRKRTHGGVGLGLAIVRRIVDLHGGRVVVESPGLGKGATFRVILPIAPRDVASSPRLRSDLAPVSTFDAQKLDGVRVLAVDDDADALELLCTILQRSGATVSRANSAATALASIDSALPDVIVSDLGMPERDGYDLVEALRKLPPDRGGQTPAVALTAFAAEYDRARALSSGFASYVSKPVDPLELVGVIARLTH